MGDDVLKMFERLKELRLKAEKMKELEAVTGEYAATAARLLKGSDCSDTRVAVFSGKALEYKRLRAEAEAELTLAEMDAIQAVTSVIESPTTAAIIIARDIKGKPWDVIASKMLCSERQCQRLAQEGRQKLSGGRV